MVALMLILSLLSVLACYGVARIRGADVKFWVIMGVLFGPLAIPFVFLAKRIEPMD